jgi:hypothetical protein
MAIKNVTHRNVKAGYTKNTVLKFKEGGMITKMVFSSVAHGTYIVMKNGKVLTTLYGKSAENVIYPFQIPLDDGDNIAVFFRNRDVAASDFHLSYEV